MSARDPGSFAARLTVVEGKAVLTVGGEIDLDSGREFAEGTHEAFHSGAGSIVLDLSQVTFCDSCGLNILLQLRRKADQRGTALILVPGPAVHRVLRIADALTLFDVQEPGRPPHPAGP